MGFSLKNYRVRRITSRQGGPSPMAMKIRFDQAAPYEVEESDVPFARAEGKELLARVYKPKGELDVPIAALVDVHGGAWSRGDRLTGAFHCRGLAASGLLVVSLDFRQGSEAKHPAASADVAAGVRYVRAHAKRLDVDPRRVGLVGSSSGGQLALLTGDRKSTRLNSSHLGI